MNVIKITELPNGEDRVHISSEEFAARFDQLAPVAQKALIAVMKEFAKGKNQEEAYAAGNAILIANGLEPCIGP